MLVLRNTATIRGRQINNNKRLLFSKFKFKKIYTRILIIAYWHGIATDRLTNNNNNTN